MGISLPSSENRFQPPIAVYVSMATFLQSPVLAQATQSVETAQSAQSVETHRKPMVLELQFSGPVGPAGEDYILAGLEVAAQRNAAALVLRLDTPGGLASSMRSINKSVLAARQPVLTFIHPGGIRAASAGTYMLYASHIAAMAPGTILGAATPVSIGGGFGDPCRASDSPFTADRDLPGNSTAAERTATEAEPGMSTMEAKVTNDAIAYIRSLAELCGRKADWALPRPPCVLCWESMIWIRCSRSVTS